MTIKSAKQQLAESRVTLKKNRYDEFEVALRESPKEIYHTGDLEDAVGTGLAMRDRIYRLEFEKVMAAADVHARETGDREPVITLMCAQDNGADTAMEHGVTGDPERYPYYWQICLGTLVSNLSDRSVDDSERNWFRAQGIEI